jgi:uncharacterized protein with von Willebrand factor type A (vWA) domain
MFTPVHELPFWHFFHRLEKELSYERWIDKYKLFLQALTDTGAFAGENTIIADSSEQEFRRFCKFLYLQDHRQEARFDELLDEALQIERQRWKVLVQAAAAKPTPVSENKTRPMDTPAPSSITTPQETETPISPPIQVPPPDDNTPVPVYLKYGRAFSLDQSTQLTEQPFAPRFLTGDEYFPLTRREMVKSWQYLRFKQKEGTLNDLDIPKTVRKVAEQGIFTEAVFKTGYANRKDAVLILADTRGSMTPFEALTDRLIETARGQGGHTEAPVFYFQNYPTGYVFQQRNLTKPLKLSDAFAAAHPSVTYAVIISDAGAARGNTDPEKTQMRTDFTRQFLAELQKYTAKIIWLNPMPSHRWEKTAACQIAYPPAHEKLPAPHIMLSVLDDHRFHFQTALHLLRLAGKKGTVAPAV